MMDPFNCPPVGMIQPGLMGVGQLSEFKGIRKGKDIDFKEHEHNFYNNKVQDGCCPFYLKIGVCRHGEWCSRIHNKPVSSKTLLLKGLYPVPFESWKISANDEFSDEDYDWWQDHLEDFYDEIFVEMASYGEVEELIMVDNISEHMFGNVYVKFFREEDAERWLQKLAGKHYNGKLIEWEFSPVTDFRDSRCRWFHETLCNRGGFCNFMHIKHIPRWNKLRLIRDMYEDHPSYDYRNYKQALRNFRHERREAEKMKEKHNVVVKKPMQQLTLDDAGNIIPVLNQYYDENMMRKRWEEEYYERIDAWRLEWEREEEMRRTGSKESNSFSTTDSSSNVKNEQVEMNQLDKYEQEAEMNRRRMSSVSHVSHSRTTPVNTHSTPHQRHMSMDMTNPPPPPGSMIDQFHPNQFHANQPPPANLFQPVPPPPGSQQPIPQLNIYETPQKENLFQPSPYTPSAASTMDTIPTPSNIGGGPQQHFMVNHNQPPQQFNQQQAPVPDKSYFDVVHENQTHAAQNPYGKAAGHVSPKGAGRGKPY